MEHFFDLVFVLAIAELAHFLHGEPDLAGFLRFTFLFVLTWWVWTGFTYYFDLFDATGPVYRVTVLTAMLASSALALNVQAVFSGGSARFALIYIALRLLLVGLYVWAWYNVVETRALSMRHAVGFSLGAALWAASMLIPEPARYWFWGAGFVVELLTPVVAQFLELHRGIPQLTHLPERYGLFTIIVLGESVTATGTALVGTAWDSTSASVAVLGFVAVACLWWLYFDHVDESALDRAYQGSIRRMLYGFGWAYGHIVIHAGLTVAAVGVRLMIEEAAHASIHPFASAALCGGVGFALLAMTMLVSPAPEPGSLPTSVVRVRLIAVALLLALAVAGGWLLPPITAGLLAGILLVPTAMEAMMRKPPTLHTGRAGIVASTGNEGS